MIDELQQIICFDNAILKESFLRDMLKTMKCLCKICSNFWLCKFAIIFLNLWVFFCLFFLAQF